MQHFGPRIHITLALGFVFTIGALELHHSLALHRMSDHLESPEKLLTAADSLAWGNRWVEARTLYSKAEDLFAAQGQVSKALYAQVSQIPADESGSARANILKLTEDLKNPGAEDSETKLRILTIRGMLEINYNANQARTTWAGVETLALRLGHVQLASRAEGEQGIAAFILGDTDTAKKQVVRAWGLSKVERDPGATVRYASVFGAGLVQIHRFTEALGPLNEAIRIATMTPGLGYPNIAVYAKIDALTGLHQYAPALKLADSSLERLKGTLFDGHRSAVYVSRGDIEREQGNLQAAAADYSEAVSISRRIENFRGVTNAGGLLAETYLKENELSAALNSIDEAIQSNTRIPDELYLAPRNLQIKAEITDKMGHTQESDVLYRKSITLVDNMIQHASTANVQRQLLAEMSDVYSGYFASLAAQKRYDEALQTLEKVRGRIETDALEHHQREPIHAATAAEKDLTKLNLSLIETVDPQARNRILGAIYSTELRISPSALTQQTIAHPVRLVDLQRTLSPNTLLIEYVLANPNSYAFAITRDSVTPYRLPSKFTIETDANLYRKEIHAKKQNVDLARHLFSELLGPVKQYATKSDLIIIPDGALHLLSFAALEDGSSYVLKTHTVARLRHQRPSSISSTSVSRLNFQWHCHTSESRRGPSIQTIGIPSSVRFQGHNEASSFRFPTAKWKWKPLPRISRTQARFS